VFCVSTRDYQRNVSGYAFDGFASFPLTPERSQIPALKKYIVSLCAPIRTKELVRYVAFTLRDLIHNIEARYHAHTTAVETTIEGRIGALRDSCLANIHRCIDKIFEDRIAGQLLGTSETVLPACIDVARKLCRESLSRFHHNRHKTYMRNKGNYKLPRSNVRPWNTQLLAPIKKSLDPIFDATINNLQNGFDQLEQEISSAMKLLELSLRAQCPEPITVELDTFIRRITHKPIILRDMENAYTNGITAFMQEQNDRCCTDIFERSYFRDEMSKVYDKSYWTRPIPGQTVKLTQMEMFE